MYEPPKSKILGPDVETGCCPNCKLPVSLWCVVKPSIKANRLVCNHCKAKIKYDYSMMFFIGMNLAYFVLVLVSIALASLINIIVTDITKSNFSDIPLISPTMFVFIYGVFYVALGYVEALYCRHRYFLVTI